MCIRDRIEKAKKPVYTYGPIIHNEFVVKDLEEKGVRVLNTEEELAALKDGIVTVSYTHLDVYKRQPLCSSSQTQSRPYGPRFFLCGSPYSKESCSCISFAVSRFPPGIRLTRSSCSSVK